MTFATGPAARTARTVVNPDYLLACAIVWRKAADAQAGLGLVEGLDSRDPNLREFSRALLMDDEENSLRLLEGALVAGVVSPEAAGGCIADTLWKRQNKWKGVDSERQLRSGSFSC